MEKTIMLTNLLIILGVFGLRIFNSITLSTYFDPDEYWQWYEPALFLLKKMNPAMALPEPYLTWEWREGIRSWFYPTLLAAFCRLVGDYRKWPLVARVFTGVVSGMIDLGTLCITRKYYESEQVTRTVMVMSLSSWFNWCYVNRGLSNQLETCFVVWGLYFWPRKSTGNWAAVGLFLALAYMIRPTALVPFALPTVFCVWRMRWTRKLVVALALCLFLMLAMVVQLYLDSLFAGSVHFSSFRFVKVNVFKGVSLHYGKNVLVYYFVVALPAMFTSGVFELVGGWRKEGASLIGKLFMAGPLVVYSLLAHKEIRFVMPLMPIGLGLASRSMSRRSLRLFVALNVLMGAYFGYVHQRGPMMAADYLARYPAEAKVLVLMPCHSIPHQGYILNAKLSIDFIKCEPPAISGESDETDLVYADYPKNYHKRAAAQEYDLIVTFGEARIDGFAPVVTYFNGFYNPDWRRRGPVVIHQRLQ